MDPVLNPLLDRLRTVNDLNAAGALLRWDQATHMPSGGGPARGRQLATLGRLSHEAFTDVEVGRLLDAAEQALANAPYDSDEAALLRVVRRDYDRSTRVPVELVTELASHSAAAYQAWIEARPARDFARMVPFLERSLELAKRYSACFPEFEHPMDALIDVSDQGMSVEQVSAVFRPLREMLVALLARIQGAGAVDDALLRRDYDERKQIEYASVLVRELGYDFERGRVDLTPHPFMTKFSLGDVRITTRTRPDDLGDGLFSMLHEAGHALYEQGIDQSYEATPLARGTSSGVHESQSRLWENVVGRSPAYWSHYYASLQATFPEALGGVGVDDFVRAVNAVQPSLIRTDADEVTYNLHVMIRFDLERALHEGDLAVRDLPRAWNERYAADLGVDVPHDGDGVLQDVHWFGGVIGGAFQGYTLGNVMSAQLYDAAVAAEPSVPGDIAAGEFGRLLDWLRTNVHRHGRKYAPNELLERATGRGLTIEPYADYLRRKFEAVYGLAPTEA